jgi:hypothetical protein
MFDNPFETKQRHFGVVDAGRRIPEDYVSLGNVGLMALNRRENRRARTSFLQLAIARLLLRCMAT